MLLGTRMSSSQNRQECDREVVIGGLGSSLANELHVRVKVASVCFSAKQNQTLNQIEKYIYFNFNLFPYLKVRLVVCEEKSLTCQALPSFSFASRCFHFRILLPPPGMPIPLARAPQFSCKSPPIPFPINFRPSEGSELPPEPQRVPLSGESHNVKVGRGLHIN